MSTSSRASQHGLSLEPEAAFERLYATEYATQVRRAALFLGSLEDANEVVQDAFVELLRRWGSIEEPGPYLERVVINACRDRYRRQRRAALALPLFRPDDTVPQNDPLWDALARLPFRHRVAVVLRYYGDLSTDEIAERLDASPGSVGPWINRGLRTLRRSLDD